MRAWVPLSFIALSFVALAPSARAEDLAADPAPIGAVGLESAATRYGTSYETVYQLNLKPSATLHIDSLELSAMLPLSASATAPTYCCRTTLGNATVSVAHRGASGGLRFWSEASVSAPSSYWSDPHANSLAATAALTRDAGYYLPYTTTLRAKLGAELELTRWLWLGASAGADYWLRHEQATNALVVPLDAFATLPFARAWSARLAFRTLARAFDPLGPRERFLHELSGGVAHEWSRSRLEASLYVPVDESLRELEMLSLAVAYSRSF
ncbi:MAG TPA: hypothetical protein VNN80_18495 [Polyangiaceae bacterium]|jgi:hypothetical protein|nr:hypothetical protein [Polyangiaceae bacterium]